MRIGEVVKQTGATAKAIRYYEALGLIAPVRLPNGYRDYGERELRLVREIRSLTDLGLSVIQTRPFLDCMESGETYADDCPASLAAYRDAIAHLDTQIRLLSDSRTELANRLRNAAYRNGEAMSREPTDAEDLTRLPPGLPRPEDDGSAAHLPGRPMPTIALPSTSGETVQLDALGGGRTVIYIYPMTGRPDVDLPDGWDTIPGARGCTAEACGFRDHHQELVSAGAARVFGLSGQDVEYQREVVERLRLPFPMLSDAALRVAIALELPTFQAAGKKFYKRLTLMVTDSAIEHVFYPVFPPDRHAEEVLRWLNAARPWTASSEGGRGNSGG